MELKYNFCCYDSHINQNNSSQTNEWCLNNYIQLLDESEDRKPLNSLWNLLVSMEKATLRKSINDHQSLRRIIMCHDHDSWHFDLTLTYTSISHFLLHIELINILHFECYDKTLLLLWYHKYNTKLETIKWWICPSKK